MQSTVLGMFGIFAGLCIIIVPIGIGAYVILKLINGRHGNTADNAEESKLIQELYHGLARMEQRVESLETLLLERERKEARHDV